MPLLQGGPPEWIWERQPGTLKWELTAHDNEGSGKRYLLNVQCGLEMVRLQYFSGEELRALKRRLDQVVPASAGKDVIEESSLASFPASDPPSWTPTSKLGPPV